MNAVDHLHSMLGREACNDTAADVARSAEDYDWCRWRKVSHLLESGDRLHDHGRGDVGLWRVGDDSALGEKAR